MKHSEHERTRGCEWWVSVVTVTVFGSLLGVFLAALRITLSAAGDGPASYPLYMYEKKKGGWWVKGGGERKKRGR